MGVPRDWKPPIWSSSWYRVTGQASGSGALLPDPLKVRVQKAGNGSPVDGVKVRWEVLSGEGAILDPTSSRTDTLGLAETRLRVGQELGPYLVRAFLEGNGGASVEFAAEAILAPSVSSIPTDPVAPGDTILLQGSNFSLVPDQNVVTFSGIRGRTVSSTREELRVEVPPCLLPRDYQVRVTIGALFTESMTLGLFGHPFEHRSSAR